MKKDEDHLPGRISISIVWLMAGGPPGTCLRLPVLRMSRQPTLATIAPEFPRLCSIDSLIRIN